MSFKLKDVLKTTPEILQQRDHCITGKRVFYSKEEARTAAGMTNAQSRQTTAMKPYRCDWCPFFHLGHTKGRRRG